MVLNWNGSNDSRVDSSITLVNGFLRSDDVLLMCVVGRFVEERGCFACAIWLIFSVFSKRNERIGLI